MPYSKPGVTVKQVPTTSSPNLATPSIYTAITGQAFNIVEMDDQTYDSVAFTYDKDNATTVDLTGMTGLSSGADIIAESVVVQLYSLTAGYKHLSEVGDTSNVGVSNKTVTITNNAGNLEHMRLDGGNQLQGITVEKVMETVAAIDRYNRGEAV